MINNMAYHNISQCKAYTKLTGKRCKSIASKLSLNLQYCLTHLMIRKKNIKKWEKSQKRLKAQVN